MSSIHHHVAPSGFYEVNIYGFRIQSADDVNTDTVMQRGGQVTSGSQEHSDVRLKIKFPKLDILTRQCLEQCSSNAMETLIRWSRRPVQSQEAQL